MAEEKFELVSNYAPTGDQPQAIAQLVEGVQRGDRCQTLLGVTGSGKTFTMANVIAQCNRPTLVLAHNKTLAAQLCTEFRSFFPNNAVEYFVSYYDYYQPEAYIPHTDTFIEKDSAVNEEIDRLRLSATASLLERRDVIVVSSVSCIYGLGEPEDFAAMMVALRVGMTIERDELLKRLVAIRYERNDIAFERNMFRVRGDTVEVWPAYWKDTALRIEFFGDEIDRISEINVVTGTPIRRLNNIPIWPATHYVTPKEKMDAAIQEIYKELEERVAFFEREGKLIEAQRIKQRTMYDIEMMQELGYCSGIENYSRIISDRPAGSAPMTLLDFFPDDFLLFVDESHVTLPQVRAMYNGDHARKDSLVKYGFRLPCAYDNRPLKFEEFEERIGQAVFVSATPGPYERERADQVVEQVIRPTGLLDPRVEVRPVTGQIDDLMDEMIATARETSAELGKLDGCTAEEAEEISRIVGLGALKYFILKVDPRKNMTFNPKESIDFNGNTGPFIQYTHARICSVMRKAAEAGIDYRQVDTAKVEPSEKEISLIQHLADFPAVVAEAGRIYSPSLIANYVYDLVKEYNQFYHDYSILREENAEVRAFRLMLSANVAKVIKTGMGLLGIEVPDRM